MKLTLEESDEILGILKARFNQNINRHKDLNWSSIEKKLKQTMVT